MPDHTPSYTFIHFIHGTASIRRTLELIGGAGRETRHYWVASWRGHGVLVCPSEAYDLADPAQEAAFRALVIQRLGLKR